MIKRGLVGKSRRRDFISSWDALDFTVHEIPMDKVSQCGSFHFCYEISFVIFGKTDIFRQ